MSNYSFKAKNKKTGEIIQVNAYDDYFGLHQYGYGIPTRNEPMREEDFYEFYEEILK